MTKSFVHDSKEQMTKSFMNDSNEQMKDRPWKIQMNETQIVKNDSNERRWIVRKGSNDEFVQTTASVANLS